MLLFKIKYIAEKLVAIWCSIPTGIRRVILYALAVCLFCGVSYYAGYRNGAQGANETVDNYVAELKAEVETSRARIAELQRRLDDSEAVNQSAAEHADRAAKYTGSASGDIDGVIDEMQQYIQNR